MNCSDIKNIIFSFKPEYRSKYNSIENIPFIEKREILSHPETFITHNLYKENIIHTYTSGSSGMVLNIPWYETDYCSSLFEMWKIRSEYGITPGDRYCTLHVGYNINGNYCSNKVVIYKNKISLSKCYLDDDSVIFYYDALKDFAPKWMLVQPGFMYGFIRSLKKLSLKLPESIKLIELTGEFCSEQLLCEFKKIYPDIKWQIMYGMQEFNEIAYGESTHLKVLDKNVYLEIVDENGNNILNGETGYIVATGLKNRYMPLIRYRTGDRGHWDKNGLLVIDQARSNDYLEIDGRRYDGAVFWDIILSLNTNYKCGIKQFQVVLKDNILNFNLLIEDSEHMSVEKLEALIKSYITELYTDKFEIKINLTNKIEPHSNGNKIKLFINLDIDNNYAVDVLS